LNFNHCWIKEGSPHAVCVMYCFVVQRSWQRTWEVGGVKLAWREGMVCGERDKDD
jgi:hypothetical protein